MGRHLIVTEEFHELKGTMVGDKIKLKTPKSGEVEYTVAGVIWSPGMDVFVSMFDMGRQFDERSAGSVFGSLDDAERDFGVEKISLFAANLNYFVEKKDLEEHIRKKLSVWGLMSGDVREIKFRIVQGFRRLLLLVSIVALSAIAVASLGVTNTIMASIRSRRWQLGILRSVGLTRAQMLRLLLAESILLGLVGSILGVVGGLVMSVDANGLSRKLLGYHPQMQIPWDIVWLGVSIILSVAFLASLLPALRAAREEPLELLQAGRASA
jgi:putative ABC transport system permease protein